MFPPPWVLLLIALSAFVATLLRARSLRAAGVRSYVLRRDDDVHGFLGSVFKIVSVGLFVALVVLSIWPSSRNAMGQIVWLAQPIVAWSGVALAVAGVVLIAAAQVQMGRSWRVGVQQDERTELVTGGIFGLSRNPIFVGMMALIVGVFLVEPSALTLAIVVAAWLSISAQMRLEESHLASIHGEAYAAFRARVRRWI